jgi:hypothetical protein
LELIITKSKGKRVILCGDWNVNFLQNSGKLQKLQNLLLIYNLENTVKAPTRITSHSKSLINVIILNSTSETMFTEVLDLGYSDHLAQIVHFRSKEELRGPLTICNRQFTDNGVEEFKYLIQGEVWEEVFASEEACTSFNLFMNTFI